jgi:hypothetical protein
MPTPNDRCRSTGVPIGLDQRACPAGVGAGELEEHTSKLLIRISRPAVLPVDHAHCAVRRGQNVVGP